MGCAENVDVYMNIMMVEIIRCNYHNNAWNAHNNTFNSNQVICFAPQVSRVLKPGGRFISVTFAQPHFRKRLYARAKYDWSIKHYHYGSSFHYFLYVLTKGEELSPEDAALERRLLEETEASPTDVKFQEVDSEDFLNNIGL